MRSGRPPLPSSGVWGLVGEDGHRGASSCSATSPAGRGAGALGCWQHPALQGWSRASCSGRETQPLGGGGGARSSKQHLRVWGADTGYSASREVGSRDPSRLSLSRELLLEPVTVLGDAWLLGCWGRWGQSHLSREF